MRLPCHQFFLVVHFGGFALSQSAWSEVPRELSELREIYRGAIVEAARPVTIAYHEKLGVVKDSMIETGDLEGAIEILEERKRVAAALEVPDTLFIAVSTEQSALEPSPPASSRLSPEMEKIVGSRWKCTSLELEISFERDGEASVYLINERGVKSVTAHSWKIMESGRIYLQQEIRPENSMSLQIHDNFLMGACRVGEQNRQAEISRILD